MLIAKAEKTDLLQLGVRLWETQRTDAVPAPDAEDCVLVWREEPGLMPDAVIVANGALQNFFAWTTTYAPHLTPISCIADVVEHCDFVASLENRNNHSRRTRDAIGYLGLVHAEVVAGFHGHSPPPFIGLTPFVSTFSWSAFQQQVLTESAVSPRTLRERWDEARRLLDAHKLGYSSQHVEEVWAFLAKPEGRQSRDAKQVRNFLESVDAGSPSFRELSPAAAHVGELEGLQSGPLEARVDLFRKLTHALYDSRTPPPSNAVVLGYALSLISQGSFAHIGLLGPSRVSDVRPLLWYGWFDFHWSEATAASPASSAATLQLLRSAWKEESGWRPRDISLSELRVLARHNDPFSDCLLDVRHPVRVALSRDSVCTIQPGQRAARGRDRQRSLFNDRDIGV